MSKFRIIGLLSIAYIPLKKLTVLIVLVLFFYQSNAQSYIKSEYCIVNDSYNEMQLTFKKRSGTVYLLYSNIIDDGNYLNDYDDSNDYAGFFNVTEMKDSSVNVKVKSYREEDQYYLVSLKFKNGGRSLIWNIHSQQVAYLPKNASFRECEKSK